jgi:F0F1-type ATP synthase membrane subunit c/vacuolar-type H+-ATPase subunit K|tara:strand:- start:12 stop:440 length:429 start_codon:yes stop_codon:yes gene_type:complete
MATSNAATTYMEHALLQFLFKNNTESFATPGNSIYVGLATAVSSIETGSLTEATFGSYARQQVQASGWTVPAVGTDTQTAVNAANIEFPASTGTNNTITHAFVADASSSGNILFVGQLDASKTIATGDIFRINAGNLSIELK